MATQRHPPEEPSSPWEQEYAIRELKRAVAELAVQSEVNSNGVTRNREDILQIKTKVGMYAVFFGGVAGVVAKLLPIHF